MADVRERYNRGVNSGNENYIGKGFLLLTTIGILILSLRPYKFCCPNEKSKKNSEQDEQDEQDEQGDESDKNLNVLDCNCVWNNPYGMVIMSILLFFLLGTTLYVDKIPELPKNLSFFDRIKINIVQFFQSVKGGFSTFLKMIKSNIPTFFKKNSKQLLLGIVALVALFYTIFLVSYTIKTLALLFVIIGGLALIYKYVKGSITSQVLSLLVSVIFFLPCLLRDLFTYLHQEFKLSTPIEWSILFVEIIVITLFFVIPKIYKNILDNRGTVLVSNSVYTNVESKVKNQEKAYKNIHNGEKNPDIKNANPRSKSLIKKHDYNYGISLWLYLDAQPPNTSYAYEKFTRLFSYERMPEILYKGSTNELKIVMQRDLLNNNEEKHTTTVYKTKELPLQKWNHFIINYDSGTLDVFINNELVISNKNISPKIEYGDIQIGSDNGVHGGIRNVQYFNQPLTKREISFLYKSG